MVESPLSGLLRERFEELGGGATRSAWGGAFGVDKATMSRLLNGILRLTRDRAQDWSAMLFKDDPVAAATFTERLLAAADATQELRLQTMGRPFVESTSQPSPAAGKVRANRSIPQPLKPLTVSEFFEDMVDNRDGVTDAARMKELLTALQSNDLENVLICCEYRDFPDAGPDAKYEYLAQPMGQAIANGVSFAMFQPFGEVIPLPTDKEPDRPAVNAAIYMMQIQIKCVDTFKLFRQYALAAMQQIDASLKPTTIRVLTKDGDSITEEEKEIDVLRDEKCRPSSDDVLVSSRLQLYNRPNPNDEYPGSYLGSGFQSRMFYIRYTTKKDRKNHARIMQWVSTPRKDLLVYRGQLGITPDALKDSFYPIPHFFDSPVNRIPSKIDDADHEGPGVRRYLKQMPGGEGLPEVEGAKSLWVSYD